MEERRKYPRLKSSFTLEVKPSKLKEGQTHDISQGGIMFGHKEPITVGTILDLTMRVPGLSGSVDVQGKVIRCETDAGGTFSVAVQFLDIDEATTKNILETIQSF